MNRTSWPVLNGILKRISVFLFLMIAILPLQAADQMTVVQSEALPPFKIQIDVPKKVAMGKEFEIAFMALDSSTGESYSKNMDLALFLTSINNSVSEPLRLRRGKAVVKKTINESDSFILMVKFSQDPADQRLPLASNSFRVERVLP